MSIHKFIIIWNWAHVYSWVHTYLKFSSCWFTSLYLSEIELMFIQWVLSYLKLRSCLFIRLILPKIELMFIHEFIIQVPFCPEQPLLFCFGLFFLLYLFVFTLHAICVGEGHAVLWTNQIAVLVGRVHDDVIVVDVLLLWRPITARWTLWRHREKYRKMFSLSSFQYNAQYILTCIIQHLFPMHYLTLMFNLNSLFIYAFYSVIRHLFRQKIYLPLRVRLDKNYNTNKLAGTYTKFFTLFCLLWNKVYKITHLPTAAIAGTLQILVLWI